MACLKHLDPGQSRSTLHYCTNPKIQASLWGNKHNVLRKRSLGHTYTNKVVLVNYPVRFMSSCDMYMSSLTLKHKTVEFKVVKRHGQAGLFCQHTQVWLESLTVYLLYCIEDSMPFAGVQLDFEVKVKIDLCNNEYTQFQWIIFDFRQSRKSPQMCYFRINFYDLQWLSNLQYHYLQRCISAIQKYLFKTAVLCKKK